MWNTVTFQNCGVVSDEYAMKLLLRAIALEVVLRLPAGDRDDLAIPVRRLRPVRPMLPLYQM